MTQYLIKIFVTTAVIVAVSELSKRSSLLGGLLASLPLISFLAMLWLYFDTRDAGKVAALSTSIFWLVLPSLAFFLALPTLLPVRPAAGPPRIKPSKAPDGRTDIVTVEEMRRTRDW